jgi:hypothetical protein
MAQPHRSRDPQAMESPVTEPVQHEKLIAGDGIEKEPDVITIDRLSYLGHDILERTRIYEVR